MELNITLWLTLLTGAASTFFLLWTLYSQWNTKRKRVQVYAKRNVQYIPMRNPFVSVYLKERMEQTKDRIIKRVGKIWGFDLMNSVTIVVADPELIQQVLSSEFGTFTNRRIMRLADPVLAQVLSNTQDDQWKRLRSIVSPTFSSASLRRMKPRIDSTIKTLLSNLERSIEDSSQIDMKPLFGAFTMETIISVAFGVTLDSFADPENPILVNARRAFNYDMTLKDFAVLATVIWTPRIARTFNIRYKPGIMDFFKDFAVKIIERKKEEWKSKSQCPGKANNFLELILEAESEYRSDGSIPDTSKYMTSEEMVAQCILFFLAGYETLSTTITMVTYFLALNPSIQERLYTEITDEIEKISNQTEETKDPFELLTLDHLSEFKYLSAVIHESLRLYPPAAAIERQAGNDIVLQSSDGIRLNIQKGDVIHIPVYSVHRDAQQYPSPDLFQPERFLAEPKHHHKYAYLPFGSGPRNCAAKSLAMMEAKLVLIHIVQQYRLSKCNRTKVPVELFVNQNFITPKEVILSVEKR